jgi:SAM-dependent methyltransferase
MARLTQSKGFVKLILPTALVRKIQNFLFILSVSRMRGLDLHLNYVDRYVLEDTIIPYFVAQKEFYKILFIGSDWYTKPYRKYFRKKEYWTIEIDESKKKYGSKRHITDSLLNLNLYFESNYFDLIVYNGVFGYGINTREDTEASFKQCFQCLREGGILVFGWNDIPERRSFPVIEECQSLQKFEPYFFAPLSTSQYLTADDRLRHTFNFYIKPRLK